MSFKKQTTFSSKVWSIKMKFSDPKLRWKPNKKDILIIIFLATLYFELWQLFKGSRPLVWEPLLLRVSLFFPDSETFRKCRNGSSINEVTLFSLYYFCHKTLNPLSLPLRPWRHLWTTKAFLHECVVKWGMTLHCLQNVRLIFAVESE